MITMINESGVKIELTNEVQISAFERYGFIKEIVKPLKSK